MAKNLGKFVFMLMAMTAAQALAAGSDDDAINSRCFSIPIGISGGQKEKIDEVELYVSSDEGRTWGKTSVIPPDKDGFTYTAPIDGTYWFKVCTVDKQGAREPKDPTKSGAVKKILVDTLPPTLRIAKTERQGENVIVSWEIQELNPDLNTLKLEYKTSDGTWYPATVIPAMIGQGQFRPLNNGPITVRMKVSDLAGNQSGPAEAELAGREDFGRGLTPTSMQVPSGGQSPPPAPAPTFPTAPTPQQPVPNPPYVVPAMQPSNQMAPGGGYQGGNSGSNNSPRIPINSTLERAPQSLVMGQGAGNIPSNWQPNNVQQPAANVHSVRSVGDPTWAPQPAPAMGGVGGIGLPPGNPPGYVATRWVNNTQTQITSNTQITLDYKINRVGPSGVGSVDLYLTQDEGRTWRRYAEDADLQPPMTVDLPGEGAYGLRLVVTSKAGLGRRPPQEGDLPDMRVEVDTTAPVVKLYRPEPDPRRRDAIILTWQASDRDLAPSPITLQWCERPDGNWQTIATDLTNSGRYVWAVGPNMVRVYLRVVARDMAGNQGFDETADPVLVDLHEPDANIIGITSGIKRP